MRARFACSISIMVALASLWPMAQVKDFRPVTEAMLRAYDKKTGQQVGAVLMPAIQSGTPMTYMVDGKQYLMVAVSGGNYSGEYIAYSLPN